MKKILLCAVALQFGIVGCQKKSNDINAKTPRTAVPDELVGRWAITSISGSTVFNIPSGTTFNTNEAFLGYTVNKNGTLKQHGYISTYQHGVSTWTKWTAEGSAEIAGDAITFHCERGMHCCQ